MIIIVTFTDDKDTHIAEYENITIIPRVGDKIYLKKTQKHTVEEVVFDYSIGVIFLRVSPWSCL